MEVNFNIKVTKKQLGLATLACAIVGVVAFAGGYRVAEIPEVIMDSTTVTETAIITATYVLKDNDLNTITLGTDSILPISLLGVFIIIMIISLTKVMR